VGGLRGVVEGREERRGLEDLGKVGDPGEGVISRIGIEINWRGRRTIYLLECLGPSTRRPNPAEEGQHHRHRVPVSVHPAPAVPVDNSASPLPCFCRGIQRPRPLLLLQRQLPPGFRGWEMGVDGPKMHRVVFRDGWFHGWLAWAEEVVGCSDHRSW
jgi:hypothetical protein